MDYDKIQSALGIFAIFGFIMFFALRQQGFIKEIGQGLLDIPLSNLFVITGLVVSIWAFIWWKMQ